MKYILILLTIFSISCSRKAKDPIQDSLMGIDDIFNDKDIDSDDSLGDFAKDEFKERAKEKITDQIEDTLSEEDINLDDKIEEEKPTKQAKKTNKKEKDDDDDEDLFDTKKAPHSPKTVITKTPQPAFAIKINRLAIIKASRIATVETIHRLLELGADINVQNSRGETALIAATKRNRQENVLYLLKQGAKKEIKDKSGKNALDWALQKKNKKIEKLLTN